MRRERVKHINSRSLAVNILHVHSPRRSESLNIDSWARVSRRRGIRVMSDARALVRGFGFSDRSNTLESWKSLSQVFKAIDTFRIEIGDSITIAASSERVEKQTLMNDSARWMCKEFGQLSRVERCCWVRSINSLNCRRCWNSKRKLSPIRFDAHLTISQSKSDEMLKFTANMTNSLSCIVAVLSGEMVNLTWQWFIQHHYQTMNNWSL